jgi:hypothetical protein
VNDIEIRDIKPILNIDYYYSYFLLAIIAIGIIFFIFGVLFLYNRYINKEKNSRVFYVQKLRNINISDAKNASYLVTKYSTKLELNAKQQKLFDKLSYSIEQYKYKKIDSTKLDYKSVILLKLFIDSLESSSS